MENKDKSSIIRSFYESLTQEERTQLNREHMEDVKRLEDNDNTNIAMQLFEVASNQGLLFPLNNRRYRIKIASIKLDGINANKRANIRVKYSIEYQGRLLVNNETVICDFKVESVDSRGLLAKDLIECIFRTSITQAWDRKGLEEQAKKIDEAKKESLKELEEMLELLISEQKKSSGLSLD